MTCQLLDQVLEWFKLFPNLLLRCDLVRLSIQKASQKLGVTEHTIRRRLRKGEFTENRYPSRRDSYGWSLWTTTTRATSPHTLILMWFRRDCHHLLNLYSRLRSQSRSLAFSLRASNHRPYSARLRWPSFTLSGRGWQSLRSETCPRAT